MSAFSWDPIKMDPEIEKNGIRFLCGNGTSVTIQRFVEDLSDLIQYKCDWQYEDGRYYIAVVPEGIGAVKVALSNKEWLSRYMRPHISEEDFDEDRYFEGHFYECLNEHFGNGKPAVKQVIHSVSSNVVREYVTTYAADGTKIRRLIGVRTLDT